MNGCFPGASSFRMLFMIKTKNTKATVKNAKTLLRLITEPDNFCKLLDEFESSNRDFYLEFRDSFLSTIDELRKLIKEKNEAELVKRFFSLPSLFHEAVLLWATENKQIGFIEQAINICTNKQQKRLLKAAVHKLAGEGISIKKQPKKSVFQSEFTKQSRTIGYSSSVDGFGEFVVWIVTPVSPGVSVFQAILSHSAGVVDFQKYRSSRNEVKKWLNEIQEKRSFSVIQVDPGYCLYQIDNAYKLAVHKEHSLPQGFLAAWNSLSSSDSIPAQHPILKLDEIQEDSKRTDLLMQGGDLHDLEEFKSWQIDTEALIKFEMQLRERQTSSLTINEAQSKDYIQTLIKKTIEDHFTAEVRTNYAQSLTDMAYLFSVKNRREPALLCLATARALKNAPQPIITIPFAENLLTKLLKMPEADMQEKEPERSEGGVILPGR